MKLKINQRIRDSFWKAILSSFSHFTGSAIFEVLSSIKKSQSDVDQQAVEAVESLRNTSVLISTLQKTVEDSTTQLQKLREEHERYSELTQIELKKAEPLLKQVERTLGKEQRKERWIALAMHIGVGFLFFVLGLVLSDPLKQWVDYLWVKISR